MDFWAINQAKKYVANLIMPDRTNVFDKSLATLDKIMQPSGSAVYSGVFYSGHISVSPGDVIRCKYKPTLATNSGQVYDSQDNRLTQINSISDYVVSGDSSYWTATMPANAAYIIVNGTTGYLSTWVVAINKVYPLSYVNYDTFTNYKLKSLIMNPNDILFGKKWAVCGDRVTYGAMADLDVDGTTRKTYQHYIGKRNGMNIVNNAVSGSTLTNVAGYNPFSDPSRYQNLGSDIDYITLWFGINDSAYATLGAITDIDNMTFYGAWNVVLDYLIATYPTAKIGIIVTYNGGLEFRDATRIIAKKWGIPVLDWMLDVNVPLLSGRETGYNIGLSDTVKTARRNTFLADGTHPNDVGYQYISTVIEKFLRSL